jgi:hypothetical protein
VEDRFDSVGDGINVDEIVARFASNVPWAWKSFWAHHMELLGNVGEKEVCFGSFVGSVNLDTR